MIEFASNRVPLMLLSKSDGVLAVITATDGASYRNVGTMMAFAPDGTRTGSLSSGCIEDDIAEHAQRALTTGKAIALRYGIGSPFFDLKLPCGGGLSVLVIPNPDRAILSKAVDLGAQRQTAHLSIDLTDGRLDLAPIQGGLTVKLEPELRFWVFGHGVEAISFALMTQATGYDVTLFGQQSLQSDLSRIGPLNVQIVPSFRSYVCPTPDNRTAVTLFFHDHENEARLLAQFLPSDALYIGAQGSLRARTRLLAELQAQGVPPDHLARLRPSFGLIPSCRDPRTLAVSVMAHVLAVADGQTAAVPDLGR